MIKFLKAMSEEVLYQNSDGLGALDDDVGCGEMDPMHVLDDLAADSMIS